MSDWTLKRLSIDTECVPDMDTFSAGGFRPTEDTASHHGVTPRELAIRKALRLIGEATCRADLDILMAHMANHDIPIQFHNIDNKILAKQETWALEARRAAREAEQVADKALYDQLLAHALEVAPSAKTMGLIVGSTIVACGPVKYHWGLSTVKAMLGATETRLNGGRLEFVV